MTLQEKYKLLGYKLVNPKSCYDCRAFVEPSPGFIGLPYCSLDFDVDYTSCSPKSPCPKPRTIKAMVDMHLTVQKFLKI